MKRVLSKLLLLAFGLGGIALSLYFIPVQREPVVDEEWMLRYEAYLKKHPCGTRARAPKMAKEAYR